MNRFSLSISKATLLVVLVSGCAAAKSSHFQEPSSPSNKYPARKTMQAFRSEQELKKYFQEIAEKEKQQRLRMPQANYEASAGIAGAVPAPPPAKAAASLASADSVTNVQVAGVDEGGIVKVHGNHLVMLRRGRLFTVAIGDNALEPVSMVDAYAPDVDPSGTWYDEMLISGDTIAVIGYSYQRGGTEVNLFQIDSAGNLSYKSTYHLRSNDYYSSRNYASRLIGSKLIFYSPLYVNPEAKDPFSTFPAVRKWHKGATAAEFHRIISPTQVYRPERPISSGFSSALHTVTVCDLARGEFDCKATSVLGPAGRVFYVSAESVYVWVTDWARQDDRWRAESMVYRMPLDGSAPSAVKVSGSPVDQFSFLESEDGYLNVLVRSDASGDSMWGAEYAAGDVALMRVPLTHFSDGTDTVLPSRYRKLPRPEGYTFQNRFVGNYLLYGTGSGWGAPQKVRSSNFYATPWAGGEVSGFSLPHGVDRIEQLGNDAVVVGTDGANLHFTAVKLGRSPEIADDYVRKDASQGELRSQGFFYKPESESSGLLGLPISTAGRPGYRHLINGSAAILFLKNNGLHFEEVGELGSGGERTANDACRASCVDWYGNARPLFIRGRYIALLGYELVEGTLEGGRIHELRRISYAPNGKVSQK